MRNKRKLFLVAVILVLGLALFINKDSYFKRDNRPTTSSAPSVQRPSFSIVLSEQNDSGESGIATIKGMEDKTLINIVLVGAAPAGYQPSHLHIGTCEKPGEIKYSINNVVNGKSETLLDIAMEDFVKELPLILNVHKSRDEISTYVSCGILTSK